MTKREAMSERRRLERAGWAQVQIRYEERRVNGNGRRYTSYGISAVDPATGYTVGPSWQAEVGR